MRLSKIWKITVRVPLSTNLFIVIKRELYLDKVYYMSPVTISHWQEENTFVAAHLDDARMLNIFVYFDLITHFPVFFLF